MFSPGEETIGGSPNGERSYWAAAASRMAAVHSLRTRRARNGQARAASDIRHLGHDHRSFPLPCLRRGSQRACGRGAATGLNLFASCDAWETVTKGCWAVAVEPTYVHVPDGRRFLRVTASRQSQRLQVVRVWGAEIASKTSKMWWMDNTELRPDHQQSTEAYIPSQTMPDYWLAIQVFSNAGKGWFRSLVVCRYC